MTPTGSESSAGVEPWDIAKLAHAAHLYVALGALVGDVAALRLTSASLSWRTAAGVQGHWREESGQFWLGRIVWQAEGRQSEQLMLTLETRVEGEQRTPVAHPTVYHCRSADGPLVGCDAETPQIYEAAQALLTQLAAEVRALLPSRSPVPEAPRQEDGP